MEVQRKAATASTSEPVTNKPTRMTGAGRPVIAPSVCCTSWCVCWGEAVVGEVRLEGEM